MNFKYGETLINMSFLKGSSSWFNLALLLFFQIKILYLHKIWPSTNRYVMKSIIALFNSILHELTNKGRKGKWMSNIYKIDASLFDVGFFTFHGHGSQSHRCINYSCSAIFIKMTNNITFAKNKIKFCYIVV